MSYSYKATISESDVGSYQERFMEYSHNWEDGIDCEKKRVKIIQAPNKDENLIFEDIINKYIEDNSTKIKIVDIKYSRSSVMLIYEPTNDSHVK